VEGERDGWKARTGEAAGRTRKRVRPGSQGAARGEREEGFGCGFTNGNGKLANAGWLLHATLVVILRRRILEVRRTSERA
jgi:hypothetical protein